METRGQASRKSVIPAEAGIHFNQKSLDSRFRGNDGLKEIMHPSSVRNQEILYRGCCGGVRRGRV